jgi:cytochrome d ubiquinol oxidase subunit II
VGLPIFYSLLGAAKVVGQTEGPVRDISRRLSTRTAALSLAATAIFLIWCLITRPVWTETWLSWPGALTTLVPLVAGGLLFIPLFGLISKGRGNGPFFLTAFVVGLFFLGAANSLYPRILPPDVTIVQAAADPTIMMVMLVGFGVVSPLIFIYTIYMYRVFGGKVPAKEQAASQ